MERRSEKQGEGQGKMGTREKKERQGMRKPRNNV
jgi:hypothetical protein